MMADARLTDTDSVRVHETLYAIIEQGPRTTRPETEDASVDSPGIFNVKRRRSG
jgi:hypothetical protein